MARGYDGKHLHGRGAADGYGDQCVHASVAAVHLHFHKAGVDHVHNSRYGDTGLRNVRGNNDLPNISGCALKHGHLPVVRHRGIYGNGGERLAGAAAGRRIVE